MMAASHLQEAKEVATFVYARQPGGVKQHGLVLTNRVLFPLELPRARSLEILV